MMHTTYKDKQLPVVSSLAGSSLIDSADMGPVMFECMTSVTAAQIAAGAVTLISDSDVPTGSKLVPLSIIIHFHASTAFTTATDIRLSDTATSPIDFITVAIANTTGTKSLPNPEAVTGVTVSTDYRTFNASGNSGKGLQIRSTGSTPAAGDTFYVYVRGVVVTA